VRPPRSDIARPTFPDNLHAGRMQMVLVSDPVADTVWKGEPILGWGGDNRLAVYLAPAARRWCLVRYCEDRSFQVLAVRPAEQGSAIQMIGELIGFLLANDARRGVDVAAEVQAANDANVARIDRELEEWVSEEGAPRQTRLLLAAMDR
jgi:hypothetical protein